MQTIAEKIARKFSRAANTYDHAAKLQHHVGRNLIALLPRTLYSEVLDAGCGTGYTTNSLIHKIQFQSLTAIDIATDLISIAKSRLMQDSVRVETADLNSYQPTQNYDLIFSNMSLQWCLDLENIICKLTAALNMNGLLAFTIPLAPSLREIKSYAATNSQPELEDIIRYIKQIGYVIHVAKQDIYTQSFPNQLQALRSLKNCGASHTETPSKLNRTHLRSPTPTTLTYHIGTFVVERCDD